MRKRLGPFDFEQKKPVNLNNKLERRPLVALKDGRTYEGQWIFGTNTREGKGILTWPGGAIFECWFTDNNANGFGRCITASGGVYVGEWAGGKMHGKGVFEWPNGNKYEGNFVDGMRHGNGVFKWAD